MDHSPRVNLHLSILWLLMSTCGIGIHFATCQAPICRRTDSVKGYRLSGNVFLSQTRDHILSCFEACKANEMCQSINFDLETNLCELNNRTRNGRSRMFLPTERSVYLDNPFRGHLGKSRNLPGLSCKDIYDSQGDHSLTSGEYWVTPALHEEPFKVYCDMVTDGGGWTLLAKTVIKDNLKHLPPMTGSKSYRGISNYSDGITRVHVPAILHLKKLIGFTQIRYYCYKKASGRVFHIMTAPDTNGESVVRYLTEDPSIQPKACGSFTRLPGDNAILSENCDKWGKDRTGEECGKWGDVKRKGTFRIYNNPIFWQDLYYINFKTSKLACDDSRTRPLPLSLGDNWQLFVR